MSPSINAGFRNIAAQESKLSEDDDFDPGHLPDAPNMSCWWGIGSLEEDIEEDSGDDNAEEKVRKAEDWRTRRDRTETRNRAFLSQMPEMVSVYMRFCAEPEMSMRPQSAERAQQAAVEEIYEIDVVDMFDTTSIEVKLDLRGNGVAPALILEGLMPCAPWSPTVAIKLCVLEAYRIIHVCCPQLVIQLFVKALCDMHGVAYRPYLCQQFSIAYNLYLDIWRRVDERIMNALGRDSSWRMKHACPAGMYTLEGKDKLIFNMLTTMDGNDSLKRVFKRVDNRDAGDGYYICREKVDRWAKSRLGEMLPMQAGNSGDNNPCADRWKNMINNVTSKMWGIFDETGIFLALCRHGFVLVLADMIRSGELAKYPLAVLKELLDVFGMDLGTGYDVGCPFGATVGNSDLGDLAREKNLKCLVGSFHGHAHNRLCQLRFLATYVEGMGLEDLEGCEHFFSRSNGLAKSCRYVSRFHRQQEITTYVKHFDSFEMYANLSKFLCNNYCQALTILKTEPTLVTWMLQEGIHSCEEFHQWLEEEKAYLLGLKDAPKTNVETLEMEYVQKLVNLSTSQAKYSVVAAEARRARSDDAVYAPGVPKAELARRHTKEKVEKDLESVQELERVLDIVERWTTTSAKWVSTTGEIKKRNYQLTLDALELLIVERIFELTKMNQSQTGYKMRKHIAKALQAGSKAVKNTIDRYNAAASVLDPPMPPLTWDQVVKYAFLADFDILRDTRAEVQSRPWTRPAYQLAMDRYFKILHAKEEIKCLNVEIPRVTEGKSEEEIEVDIQMAVQVQLYRQRRGHFDDTHMRRFWALAKKPGFTASLRPGISVERRAAQEALREAREAAHEAGAENEMAVDETVVVDAAMGTSRGPEVDEGWEDVDAEEDAEDRRVRASSAEESDDEDEGDEAKEEAVSGLLYRISMLAIDGEEQGSGDEA
ncbi:hypothetical protein B0H14DRAFT_3460500 [Mycena olivaceomarginata]|nr:hypothetical protein B0H14DRAFT_3460500 [Mycena olivaceomarginata]